MKLLIIFIFLFILSLTGKSQNLPVNFDDCKTDMFFAVVDEQPKFGSDSLSVAGYFNQYFGTTGILDDFSGKIVLGILIFDDGKPCCKSFINMSTEDIKSELFKEAVNQMPYWLPAKQNNKTVPFLIQLPLNFKNGQVISP